VSSLRDRNTSVENPRRLLLSPRTQWRRADQSTQHTVAAWMGRVRGASPFRFDALSSSARPRHKLMVGVLGLRFWYRSCVGIANRRRARHRHHNLQPR
jgi:hypothetical protein